jgi:hypothetical protein
MRDAKGNHCYHFIHVGTFFVVDVADLFSIYQKKEVQI